MIKTDQFGVVVFVSISNAPLNSTFFAAESIAQHTTESTVSHVGKPGVKSQKSCCFMCHTVFVCHLERCILYPISIEFLRNRKQNKQLKWLWQIFAV